MAHPAEAQHRASTAATLPQCRRLVGESCGAAVTTVVFVEIMVCLLGCWLHRTGEYNPGERPEGALVMA